MKLYKPTQIGDPILRKRLNKVVDPLSKKAQTTIKRLITQMRANQLIGMAANQIGVDLQIFVTEIRPTKYRKVNTTSNLQVFINPNILETSKYQSILYEGCGSLAYAGLFGPVKRPSKITVKALDQTGKEFTLTATGLLAKCIQHEYDHLQGIICIDKFSSTLKIMDREYHFKNKTKI